MAAPLMLLIVPPLMTNVFAELPNAEALSMFRVPALRVKFAPAPPKVLTALSVRVPPPVLLMENAPLIIAVLVINDPEAMEKLPEEANTNPSVPLPELRLGPKIVRAELLVKKMRSFATREYAFVKPELFPKVSDLLLAVLVALPMVYPVPLLTDSDSAVMLALEMVRLLLLVVIKTSVVLLGRAPVE